MELPGLFAITNQKHPLEFSNDPSVGELVPLPAGTRVPLLLKRDSVPPSSFMLVGKGDERRWEGRAG